MKSRRRRAAVLLALLLSFVAFSGCTVTKPLVCAIGYPVRSIGEAARSDDEDEKFERMPAVLAVLSAPVLIPLTFGALSVVGATGGLVTGFASDLNLILGHADLDDTRRSLLLPFNTNIRKQED